MLPDEPRIPPTTTTPQPAPTPLHGPHPPPPPYPLPSSLPPPWGSPQDYSNMMSTSEHSGVSPVVNRHTPYTQACGVAAHIAGGNAHEATYTHRTTQSEMLGNPSARNDAVAHDKLSDACKYTSCEPCCPMHSHRQARSIRMMLFHAFKCCHTRSCMPRKKGGHRLRA